MSKLRPGMRFGHLTIRQRARKSQKGNTGSKWVVDCDCGNRLTILQMYLTRANYPKTSCGECTAGVKQKDPKPEPMTKYLQEYHIWRMMIYRTTEPSHEGWKYYGGRGIKVAAEWHKLEGFWRFLKHIGPRPGPEYTVDRINNDGHYEPNNVRWATGEQQAANKGRGTSPHPYPYATKTA